MTARSKDRGAAAVEFALVVPVLLLLVIGIAEFGRAYFIQTTLSAAAREGVRVMALQDSPTAARIATEQAAATLGVTDEQISVSPSSCVATDASRAGTAVVTITYPMTFITQLFGASITLTGEGVMRCNG